MSVEMTVEEEKKEQRLGRASLLLQSLGAAFRMEPDFVREVASGIPAFADRLLALEKLTTHAEANRGQTIAMLRNHDSILNQGFGTWSPTIPGQQRTTPEAGHEPTR